MKRYSAYDSVEDEDGMWVLYDDVVELLARLAPDPSTALDVERWYEAVSDSLAAATEGTDYAEAPEPSDEPKSPYVLRLTHELLARLQPREYAALTPGRMTLPPPDHTLISGTPENKAWHAAGEKE